jgi:hypothetical protein
MSPTVILLIILGAAIWLPTITLVGAYFFRRLQQQERLAAIARGADLAYEPEETLNRTRRSGIVCLAAGIGLSIGDIIVATVAKDPQALVGQAVAIVPFAIGVGLLIDHRIGRRDLAARRGGDR